MLRSRLGLSAHRRAQGALELDLFIAVGEGNAASAALAARGGASTRGARILCDYLTVLGFLVKDGERYALTADSAAILDRRSPGYLGGTVEFALSPALEEAFRDMLRRAGFGRSTLHQLATGPRQAIVSEA